MTFLSRDHQNSLHQHKSDGSTHPVCVIVSQVKSPYQEQRKLSESTRNCRPVRKRAESARDSAKVGIRKPGGVCLQQHLIFLSFSFSFSFCFLFWTSCAASCSLSLKVSGILTPFHIYVLSTLQNSREFLDPLHSQDVLFALSSPWWPKFRRPSVTTLQL